MMKKQYGKPQLFVENFVLTQTLSTCAVLIGLVNQACVLADMDSTNAMKDYAVAGLFYNTSACLDYITDKDYEDGICYHTSVNTVFAS